MEHQDEDQLSNVSTVSEPNSDLISIQDVSSSNSISGNDSWTSDVAEIRSLGSRTFYENQIDSSDDDGRESPTFGSNAFKLS